MLVTSLKVENFLLIWWIIFDVLRIWRQYPFLMSFVILITCLLDNHLKLLGENGCRSLTNEMFAGQVETWNLHFFASIKADKFFLFKKIKKETKLKKFAIFREKATSNLSGFHSGPLSWLIWNLEMLVLCREENRSTETKTLGARREPATN